jgi:pimeloyl-ACP methyl ester carboxylesterase
MPVSAPCDGFRLTYDRNGNGGRAVVLLHGWPGDRSDYRLLAPLLTEHADVVVPDLRGFGESDKHRVDPAEGYGVAAQARSVAALISELELSETVVAGYDIGSRIAQEVARRQPELVAALVVAPPLPGIGRRILSESAIRAFWYQSFHQLELAEQLIDGHPDAVRSYLRHFWTAWSGPDFELDDAALEHLVARYSPPGAFVASIGWYRAGAGAVARSLAEQAPEPQDRLGVPTTVLWPEFDPLFAREFSDRLDEFFADVSLHFVDGVGHFSPVECPEQFAELIRGRLR